MQFSQKTVNATVNIVKIDIHSDIESIISNHFRTIIESYSVMTASNVRKKFCQNIYATQCMFEEFASFEKL